MNKTKQPEALLGHEFCNQKLYSKKLKCGRKGPKTPSRTERTHGMSGIPGAQDAREPGQRENTKANVRGNRREVSPAELMNGKNLQNGKHFLFSSDQCEIHYSIFRIHHPQHVIKCEIPCSKFEIHHP